MIREKNGVFWLGSGDWCCLLRVSRYGHIEHLHFGRKLDMEDADALALNAGTGWGTAVRMEEFEPASCLDYTALAWSGCGRGDYRDTPVELEADGEAMATDFRYKGFRILQGCAEMKSTLPQPSGAEDTLELTLEMQGLKLLLFFTVYPQALTRRAVLCNNGVDKLCVRRLLSTCCDLTGRYEMTSFHGAWLSEMHRQTTPVEGLLLVNQSSTGTSSHHHNPGFMLSEYGAAEDHGCVYGFNLIYSGNHYASVRRSYQGLTRVVQGISPENFVRSVAVGECFETPAAVLAWSDGGFGGLSAKMHDFINGHITPEPWRYRERPIQFDSWEGCGFDVRAERVLPLAKQAAEAGCELFILDDGWCRLGKTDCADLGDFKADPAKFPQGLGKFADDIRACGLDFGIWLEPECANLDSDLYRAHPDWFMTERGMEPVFGRHTLVLDYANADVRDYIVNSVRGIIDETKAACVKWDMNRHLTALGSRAYDYVLGLYDVLGRIFSDKPDVLLLSSAAGGSRFDLGMLSFSAQVWSSDDTDPVDRLEIQQSYSYLYPQCLVGANVSHSPQLRTGRITPATMRGCVASFAVLGYELDFNEINEAEKTEIKQQIEFYKQHRKLLQFGRFRRIETDPDATSWQVSDGETTLVGMFHSLVHAAPDYELLRVKGLDAARRYALTSRAGITPAWELEASGAAFEAGVCMLPNYYGLAKSDALRFPADYDANIFKLV